jgi:hypothetical protein
MFDCSFKIEIGADQTRPVIIYGDEKKLTRRNLANSIVRVYFFAPFALQPILMKELTITNANLGLAEFSLTPVESRLFTKPRMVSFEVRTPPSGPTMKEIIVGRGIATGVGGSNLDG